MRWRPPVHLIPLALLCPLLPTLGGCATTHAPASWVRSQGGLLPGAAQSHAQQIADRLAVDRPALRVNLSVLDTGVVSAFCWPDRQVFVTRGLVERVGDNDDELAAAIAHELGHLIDGHHVGRSALVGLRGCRQDLIDAEGRADELGAQILESRGIDRAAMSRLLTKVIAATPRGATKDSVEHRLALLDGEPRTNPRLPVSSSSRP